MDAATIDHVLHNNQVDPVSGMPFSAIIFMLYYGLELNHFLLNISLDIIKKIPLKQYHVGTTSTYLSGSAAEGLYLNTRKIQEARDIDIVTIWKKYQIREKCYYDDFSVEEWLLKYKLEGEERCTCVSDKRTNITAKECDDRYLNIKVLPETPPGYVLLQKCRRHPAPVQTLDDILVSSLKTTEARMNYLYDIKDKLKQKFEPGQYFIDEDGAHEEGALFDFISTQGPAVTATMAGPGLFGSCWLFEGIDIVFAVPYPLPWPNIAKEWISRQRPSGWPSKQLIESVISDGCTLVPKGSEGSALQDYEWRISFTGELRLSRSLSLVQRQLLHVLKALVSEPQNELEMKAIDIDLTAKIESFQFLNLMFRESEILDKENWNPVNIAHMLFHFIDTYLEHFELGDLSHYILKSRNIFEKFRRLTAEERDALLYTLHRIRLNPLGQILQQERYIRLKPILHKQVFSPFVEEVKTRGGTFSQKLYVNTLVTLVKAHLLEKSYSSAYTYGMDAYQFYKGMNDDTFSDIEYIELFFIISLSCHRVGLSEKVLKFFEKLNTVMTGQSEETLLEVFGTRNYAELLVLFARTLIVNVYKGAQYINRDEVVHYAIKLYNDALKLDPDNRKIMIDLINTQMQFGDQQKLDILINDALLRFTELYDVISQPLDHNDNSEYWDAERNDVEVIYDREAYVNAQTNAEENAIDASQFEELIKHPESESHSDLKDTVMSNAEIIYDKETYINGQAGRNKEAIDTSQFDYLFDNSESEIYQEAKELNEQAVDSGEFVILSAEFETENVKQAIPVQYEDLEYTQQRGSLPNEIPCDHLDEEQNQVDFIEDDLWKIDRTLMKDYYQMKAFEGIKMKHKVETIRKRIESKLKRERQKGIKVSFTMLESLYNIYESTLRWKKDFNPDKLSAEIISDSESHVIYSTADSLLLDDMLISLFMLFDSTEIRIPVNVLFTHLFIEYCKLQGKWDQAKKTLERMKYSVNTLQHAFDVAVVESLIASHMKWFGDADSVAEEFESSSKERLVKSKDTVLQPSVKHKIFNWINQVFSTIAVNEPYNKYLDDIFAV